MNFMERAVVAVFVPYLIWIMGVAVELGKPWYTDLPYIFGAVVLYIFGSSITLYIVKQ